MSRGKPQPSPQRPLVYPRHESGSFEYIHLRCRTTALASLHAHLVRAPPFFVPRVRPTALAEVAQVNHGLLNAGCCTVIAAHRRSIATPSVKGVPPRRSMLESSKDLSSAWNMIYSPPETVPFLASGQRKGILNGVMNHCGSGSVKKPSATVNAFPTAIVKVAVSEYQAHLRYFTSLVLLRVLYDTKRVDPEKSKT
jgi:hypothetical protein